MRILADTLNVRFFGDINERVARLRSSLAAIGVAKSTDELATASGLESLTAELDCVARKEVAWNTAVVELIQVAEVWGDRQLAKRVLAWTRASAH